MGDLQTQNQQNATQPNKKGLLISDLTSKYRQKADNYDLMVAGMSDEQKKIFQFAINLYDIQLKQDRWDSYVGYALKALLMSGYYYNVLLGTWDTCTPYDAFVPTPNVTPDGEMIPKERAYQNYIETLYPRQACSLLGLSRWDILDSEVDISTLKLAMGGEMSYEEYDLAFSLESYELGGEQSSKKTAVPKIVHPEIPISPNIDIAELTKGDTSNDKFIYAYTDSGVSKNNRDWRPMIMDRIAQQVMDQNPPGNMGHVNPKNVGYELPLPVVTWIGAVTELLPDGVKRLWLKGYVIPTADGANLKTYVRAKAINSISVYGGLTLLPDPVTGVQSVLDIDLKSIDISGKLKEGLNSGITELAGEMHEPKSSINNQESEEQSIMADLSRITLADLKLSAPQLFGEMRTEVMNSLTVEEKNKIVLEKAGEMDALTAKVGANPKTVIENYQKYAGEMAEAVGLTPATGMFPDMGAVVAKVKEYVTALTGVKEAVKPAEGQSVVDKASELAQANQLNLNTQAIQAANAKFNELTAGVTSDAVKNLVAMQYQGILQAKPESLPSDYATSAIQTLESSVPTTIETVVQNAQSLLKSGQQAGEMALFDNLGVGAGSANGGGKPDVSKMSDLEYAKSLGYEF